MTPQLLIAILTGLGGMLGWGLGDFFAKKTIDKIGDVTTLFWGQLFGIIPIFILFLFDPHIPVLSASKWIYLVVLGVWSGLSYIPAYVAFGKGKISLLSPIFASYAVVVALISAIFLGEIIPFGRGITFVLVFFGIILINGNPRDLWMLIRGQKKQEEQEKVKGLKEILIAVFLFSLWFLALDHFLNGGIWVPFLLIIRIFSTLSLYTYARTKNITLRVADKSLWKFLFLIGFFDVAAFASVSLGFSKTPYLSVVAMLSGAFSLPTIMLARIFLKEKVTRIQTIGSLVVVAGIILLSLLK